MEYSISIYMYEKKKSCHLVPTVVMDLPLEGSKVEGSDKKQKVGESSIGGEQKGRNYH